ncbi:MAG: TIM barrel protein [Clostridia bacterium]|nr:TIM barrel protein [Clostridia bacterium]
MSNKSIATFGPGGNSASFYDDGFKSTVDAPAWVAAKGLDAYEYEAGNGLTASDATLKKIGDAAKENGILMSFHTPYFISLSGIEEEKRLKSIDYISRSLHAASLLGADTIVIHTGSAAKITRAEAMKLAADTLEKNLLVNGNTDIRMGLETMGKINQLGTLEEVIELCKIHPAYHPIVDFGHMNARNIGSYFTDCDSYRRVFDAIGSALGDKYVKNLHCHFSKIEYTKAGEKKHLTFADNEYGPEFEPLAEAIILEGVAPRIICESDGSMAEDALYMKNAYLAAKGASLS